MYLAVWTGYGLLTARFVLVVAAHPKRRAGVLVATLRGAVKQGVVGHRELKATRRADVCPVDDPVCERVCAQTRPLRDVSAGTGAAHLSVLDDRYRDLTLQERL